MEGGGAGKGQGQKAYLTVPSLSEKEKFSSRDSGLETSVTIRYPEPPEAEPDSDTFSVERRRHSSGDGPRRRNSFMDITQKFSDVGKSVKHAANKELKHEVVRFTRTTTAHGVPMILQSRNWFTRGWWICLTVISMFICVNQCSEVIRKFQRNDKIVNVELQFEQAPFPAITVCNLNPFKNHLARKVPEISETLDAFHQAVSFSKEAVKDLEDKTNARYRRSNVPPFRYVQYEPIMSECECDKESKDCVQKDGIPKSNKTYCICNFDRQDSTAWPCFHVSKWLESKCPECNDIGYCNLPETNGSTQLPCLCHQDNYCLLRPERLKRVWEIRGHEIPDEGSPFRADFMAQLKSLGYENITDEVAITTKTKEKLILTMAGLPVHRRIALSYGKSEFIRMCSFNAQQCSIINDFKLHVDPSFGNCYTFNANRTSPMMASRAGPSYGLRLMVYINSSDYLPTTESAGVRIVIHGQSEWPFPEAFGYSAPTGSLSSFGMSMRKVNRLAEPYGDCILPEAELPSNYIYQNHVYEPEGCYKSCYQQRIVRRCGCADPRYPMADNDTQTCDSLDPISRNCLIVEGSRFTKKNTCDCKHRCSHNVYTTTFSSAKLASGAFRANCKEKRNSESCFEYDGNNAAMVEIYYEQMSFEVLTERESYLFVNMVSDIGGQIGLWLGASILTVIEIVIFISRILTVYCRKKIRHSGHKEFDFDKRRRSSSLSSQSTSSKTPKLHHYGTNYSNSHPKRRKSSNHYSVANPEYSDGDEDRDKVDTAVYKRQDKAPVREDYQSMHV